MKKEGLDTRIRGKKYIPILRVGVISTFKPYLGINLAYGSAGQGQRAQNLAEW